MAYINQIFSKSAELYRKLAKYDLLIDRIIHLESKHCQNHDQYFVFEGIIRETLLLWTRDLWVPERLQRLGYKIVEDETANTNSLIPIWGISLYLMPLCYLFENPGELYFTFRELYTR